jgi:hypothetical protein
MEQAMPTRNYSQKTFGRVVLLLILAVYVIIGLTFTYPPFSHGSVLDEPASSVSLR